MGLSFMYGDAMGQLDQKRADELFGMSVIISVVSGLALFAMMLLFREEYFAFLNPAPDVSALARDYYSYFMFVVIIDPLTMLLVGVVYNDGDELISNISNFTNIIGNVVLSLLFAFTFKMGLAGVALGTLCKDIISLAVLSCHFLRKTNSLHMRLYFSLRDMLSLFWLGFVDSAVTLMWGILLFVMNKIMIACFGSEYLPVLSMAISILELSVVFDGVAEAMIPLISVYYSEKNYPAVRKIMNLAQRVSVVEGIAFSVILFVFAEYVPALFGIDDAGTVELCVRAVRIISTTLTVSAVLYLFETYYMIQGKDVLAVASSFMRNLIFILAVSLPAGLAGSIDGVWAGFAAAQVFTLVMCSVMAFMMYGRKLFPLYLEEKSTIKDYDLMLSTEAVISVRDSASEFLRSHGIQERTVTQVMLIIEETGMLILERNTKRVLAEYTIEIEEEQSVKITIRDDGKIFDVTDEDLNVTSLRSYVVSQLMTTQKQKKNIITTSFNRNMFDVRGGIARKLILR